MMKIKKYSTKERLQIEYAIQCLRRLRRNDKINTMSIDDIDTALAMGESALELLLKNDSDMDCENCKKFKKCNHHYTSVSENTDICEEYEHE